MYKHKITVFTPTYNRAYIIKQLYASLRRQTFTDFEWLVIDDGSIDQTESLFAEWIAEETSFPIRYYKQQNGGKCRAINKAVDLALGELFFTVDSDDYLTDDALEKIVRWEAELLPGGNYCGIAGNLGTSENETPNRMLDTEFYDGDLLDRYTIIDGERAIVFYTDIHKQYKYPEFEGEKFITEAVVWNRMAHDGYKMRFYNDIIWIYEYQSDGLTSAGNKLFLDNPHGYCLWLKEKQQFINKNSYKNRLKLYYGLNFELRNLYSPECIANCLGTYRWIIGICNFLLKIKTLFR